MIAALQKQCIQVLADWHAWGYNNLNISPKLELKKIRACIGTPCDTKKNSLPYIVLCNHTKGLCLPQTL